MTLEQRIRRAEAELFASVGAEVDESFLDLAGTGAARAAAVTRQRSATGSAPRRVAQRRRVGAPVQRAVRLAAARGRPSRSRAVGPRSAIEVVTSVSARGELIDDIFDALELDDAPVVGHSLGGMLALWYAAAGTERISRLVAIGEPAVALPGVRVRMPLSLLTVRGLGRRRLALARAPAPSIDACSPRASARAEVAAAPDSLIDALRLSARRPGNARTVSSLMHAIDHFRRPRPESVLTTPELPRSRYRRCSSGEPTPRTSPPTAPGPRSTRSPARRFTRCPADTVPGSWTPNAARSSSKPTSLPQ